MMWDEDAVHLSDEHFDFFTSTFYLFFFYVGWQELFLWDLDKEEAFLLPAFGLLTNWDNPSDQGLGIDPKILRVIYVGF